MDVVLEILFFISSLNSYMPIAIATGFHFAIARPICLKSLVVNPKIKGKRNLISHFNEREGLNPNPQ